MQNNNDIQYFDSLHDTKFNDGNEYYTVKTDNGEHVLYIGIFPVEWAINHKTGTGPHACNNCLSFGSIEGVFIGYCANCSDYIYRGARGNGMNGDGIEYDYIGYRNYESAFDTYLKGIDLTLVSDKMVDISETQRDELDFIKYTDETINGEAPTWPSEYYEDDDNYTQDSEEEEFIEYGFTSLIGGGGTVFDIDSDAGYNSY